MIIERSKLHTFFWLGLTLLALVLLAASLPRLEFQPGQPFPLGGLLNPATVSSTGPVDSGSGGSFLTWLVVAVLSIFILLVILWLLIFIFRPQARQYLLSRLLSYLVLFLLIAGLMYALRQQIMAGQAGTPDPQLTAPAEAATATDALLTPPALVVDPPQWLISLITLLFISLVLGLVWLLWRRQDRPTTTPAELIAREAYRAVQAIQAGTDLKDTVLNCYRQMTEILQAERGIERQQAMTPREFEQHLAGIGLSDDHIGQLTRLFEQVRYGHNRPTGQDEQEAIACLNTIVQRYGPAL
jgi:hypothetical protein